MREIKFRAWCAKQKKMGVVDVLYLPEQEGNCFGMLSDRSDDLYFKKGNAIIMQYTGLKDKHNNEIYEGDIVYISGYGEYIVEWPFIELFNAAAENDIGEIRGNIYDGKS